MRGCPEIRAGDTYARIASPLLLGMSRNPPSKTRPANRVYVRPPQNPSVEPYAAQGRARLQAEHLSHQQSGKGTVPYATFPAPSRHWTRDRAQGETSLRAGRSRRADACRGFRLRTGVPATGRQGARSTGAGWPRGRLPNACQSLATYRSQDFYDSSHGCRTGRTASAKWVRVVSGCRISEVMDWKGLAGNSLRVREFPPAGPQSETGCRCRSWWAK